MHRAKSNTSLDERALTEAAKALKEPGRRQAMRVAASPHDDGNKARTAIARIAIISYLAALPEPPLDEWLSGLLSLHAIVGAIETSSKQRPLPLAQRIQRALLEALAEHRKEGQHG